MTDSKLQKLRTITPDVSRETFERLLAFEALFLKWSKSFNLAAPSTLNDFWSRHVVDSFQLTAIRKPTGTWVDIGSGGGLPGLVMAIVMCESPGGIVHLVESNGKKAAFLRQALLETGGSGVVHRLRIEDAYAATGPAEVITARALTNLDNLLELSRPWMIGGATALFHKGREYREEIIAAGDGWRLDLLEHASAVDRASTILEIRSALPIGDKA
ncbi:MAG: 16S rRNA (guanine(527)-N(7))-methyltransferase RsmG [Rhizobiaceae bacterium]